MWFSSFAIALRTSTRSGLDVVRRRRAHVRVSEDSLNHYIRHAQTVQVASQPAPRRAACQSCHSGMRVSRMYDGQLCGGLTLALPQASQRFSAGKMTRLTALPSASGLPIALAEDRASNRTVAQPMDFRRLQHNPNPSWIPAWRSESAQVSRRF
jgi:hypothetical protein